MSSKQKDKKQKNPENEAEEEKIPVLIDKINLSVAGIKALNPCICLADAFKDGNYRLICADMQKCLKVFKGNLLQNEGKLKVIPSGVVPFYSLDKVTKTVSPFLAVTGGSFIYIYRNLKGTTKFPIENEPINYEEADIYKDYRENKLDDRKTLRKLKNLKNKLDNLRDNPNYKEEAIKDDDNVKDENDNVEKKENDDKKDSDDDEERKESMLLPLTQTTIELLQIKSENKQLEFLLMNKFVDFSTCNFITCIAELKKNSEDPESRSLLVVGTETGSLVIIDPEEGKPMLTVKLPETPFIIQTKGAYERSHKIFVADRGFTIYMLGTKNKIKRKIIVGQNIIDLKCFEKSIYVVTTGRNYMSFTTHCDKNYSIYLKYNILCMELYYRKKEIIPIILISIKNNQVRLYNEQQLIYIIKCQENVFGMKVGRFEFEDDSLVLLGYSGSMTIKTFNKDVLLASLKCEEDNTKITGKLNIPRKTQVYVELVEREKENSEEIQNIFQKDLLKLRYKAMDTYVKMLKMGNAPQNYSTASTLKISASLQGLGPYFKINLILDNCGTEPICNGELTLDYNRNIFIFDKEIISLGIIMPNIPVKYSIAFRNISEEGLAGNVKVIVVDKYQTTPLIQTNIKVPVSELDIL